MTEGSNSTKLIKIILLGESGVGKTNLINILVGKPFEENSFSSLSSSYSKGNFKYEGKDYPYVLWDTTGQESYRSLNKIFMKNSKIVIFVYSIDNMDSFKELGYWIDSAKNEVDQDCIMAIAGNKSDLIYQQKVPDDEAQAYAKKLGMKLKFTSALADPPGFKAFIDDLLLDYIFGKDRAKNKNDTDKNKGNNKSITLKTEKKKRKFCWK